MKSRLTDLGGPGVRAIIVFAFVFLQRLSCRSVLKYYSKRILRRKTILNEVEKVTLQRHSALIEYSDTLTRSCIRGKGAKFYTV